MSDSYLFFSRSSLSMRKNAMFPSTAPISAMRRRTKLMIWNVSESMRCSLFSDSIMPQQQEAGR